MFAKTLVPTIAALGAGLVYAQDICSQSEIAINSAADAAALEDCSKLDGTVTIGPDAIGDIAIDGPTSIKGDLICANNGELNTLTSSSLESIGGAFTMTNVTGLTTLEMEKLNKVKSLDWQTLARLETVSFSSSGLIEADSIRISDTFLSTLNAIRVTSTKKMEIDNNRRLIEWESGLETLSDELVITANGFGLEVAFPDLVWIANMTISNVSSISIPSLEVVNGSMRFDSNFFTDFSAPKMVETKDGDLSFTSNAGLKNISFPSLTQVAGGFTIANNTQLEAIDGFPELETIGGAVLLRGNFTSVELPALNDVKGAFDISSTDDIETSCAEFKKLAPSSQGGNGKIQGEYACTSNNENANNIDSDGSSSSDDEGAGVSLASSLSVVLTIAGVAVAQALL